MYGIRRILDVQESKIQEECNEYYNKYNKFSGMVNCIKKLNPNKISTLSKDIVDIDKAIEEMDMAVEEEIDRAVGTAALSESFSKNIKDIDRAVEEIDKALRVKELKCISSQLIQARTMLLRQKEKICRILKRLDE